MTSQSAALCYFRQLDLPDGRQYLTKLRDRFASNQDRYATIIQWAQEWSSLGDDAQWSDDTVIRLKSQALQAVVWLDGDFDLIRELNSILPRGIAIFCAVTQTGRTSEERNKRFRRRPELCKELVLGWRHIELGITNEPLPESHCALDPTKEESEKLDSPGVKFVVLSTRKWADILPTVPHYATGHYHSAFAIDDLRSAVSEDDKLLAAETFSDRNGWLECLMDLLAHQVYDDALDKDGQDMAFRRLVHLAKKYSEMPPHLFVQNVTKTETVLNWGNNGSVMEVWKGHMHNQPVCLKALRADTKMEREIRNDHHWEVERNKVRDILRETLAWHKLCHPNISEFLGINRHSSVLDRWTIVIPWMENRDLLTYVNKSTLSPTSLKEFRERAVWGVAQGLAYLHTQEPPIYHGDLQASHILVTDDLRCCLFNFGRVTVSGRNQAQSISERSGEIMRWQPLEVHSEGLKNVRDKRAVDVFAFGCVISEIYTGEIPWKGTPSTALKGLLMKKAYPNLPRTTPRYIRTLATECWSPEPSDRPLMQEVEIPDEFLFQDSGPRFTIPQKSYDTDFAGWLNAELGNLSASPEGSQAIEAAGKIVLPIISSEPSPTYQALSSYYSKIKKPRRAARLQLIYDSESPKFSLGV